MKTALRSSRRSTVSQRLKRTIPVDYSARVRAAILAKSPVVYWRCDDAGTLCEDDIVNRDLGWDTAPVSDPIFGKVGVSRAAGSIAMFTYKALGGWFYFPSPVTSATAFKGLMANQQGSQALAVGGNITGTFANEVLIMAMNGGNSFRAWNDAAGVISAGWHYIFATYRTSTAKWELFVDAVSKGNADYGSQPTALDTQGTNVYNGSWVDGSAGSINGTGIKMAHLAYFNSEFSDADIASIVASGPNQLTYSYTGASSSIVVPPWAKSVLVDIYGASGGDGGGQGISGSPSGGGAKGLGGRLQTTFDVTAGETLVVNVGGAGGNGGQGADAVGGTAGWNGGRAGGAGGGNAGGGSGGGGGGATDIRRGAAGLADRIVVAGGGGGGGSSRQSDANGGGLGGGGGGTTAVAGTAGSLTGGGGGATQAAGGSGGSGAGAGSAGALGLGGVAGGPYGGGGAGGYYGGGGGGGTNDSYNGTGGGGGGGSSFASTSSIDTTHTQAARNGNGQATLTFSPLPAAVFSFAYTGAAQSVVVPAWAKSMIVDIYGAQGGGYAPTGKLGGLGGRVQATIPVTPGETLQVNVGGTGVQSGTPSGGGGWNGGGLSNADASSQGFGGGGATDIRRGGTALANRILVAGGGGGAGYDSVSGGAGGGLVGQAGPNGAYVGGGGGTQSAGGAAGSGGEGGSGAGALGQGGAAGLGRWGIPGAGGGGYYGGGGGEATINAMTASAGGGGSSYAVPTAVGVTHNQGVRSGHGQATITFSSEWIPTNISDLMFWLDADTLSGVDGSEVAAWTDSLGMVFEQLTQASRPTLRLNTLNGHKSVRFDGSNDGINSPNVNGPTDYTLFIVGKHQGSAYETFIKQGSAGGRRINHLVEDGTLKLWRWDQYNSQVVIPTNTPKVISYVLSSGAGTEQYWINAVAAAARSGAFPAAEVNSPIYIGWDGSPTHPLNGDIWLIGLYSRALTTEERQEIEAKLMAKYALS